MDSAGLTAVQHTRCITKGPQLYGAKEAEEQVTYRGWFTKDQSLDPNSVLKARTVCQGLQMVDGAIAVLRTYLDKWW